MKNDCDDIRERLEKLERDFKELEERVTRLEVDYGRSHAEAMPNQNFQ